MAEGRSLFEHRLLIQNFLATPPPVQNGRILFMGDSTVMGRPGHPSWAHLVGERLERHGVTPVHSAYPGSDVFQHYCVSGAFLAWRPDAVVVVVNHRMMAPKRRSGAAMDLCSFLPPGQLGRSLGLPWHDRGMSLVRLGLTQALAWEPVEEAVIFFAGARRLFADRWMGSTTQMTRRTRMRNLTRSATRYDQPLWPRQPLVRMLGALVREARTHGAQVLVVVTPVPLSWMARTVHYDPATWRRRQAVLRRTVESAGGELVDLHDLLESGGFRDFNGHMNPYGHTRVANAVSPRIHRLLGLGPPELLPVPDPP